MSGNLHSRKRELLVTIVIKFENELSFDWYCSIIIFVCIYIYAVTADEREGLFFGIAIVEQDEGKRGKSILFAQASF